MRKFLSISIIILSFGMLFTACKVKQKQHDLSSQDSQSIISELLEDDEMSTQLAKTWTINAVNYQADARKDVLYQRGETANLRDYSKESFKLSPDGTVTYTDEGGDKHHGKWKLVDHNTKLKMVLEDKKEVFWDIIKTDKKTLVLHMSINARKVKWDIQKIDDIDIPTAAVFAGFFAGIVDENTQLVSITYQMSPRG
ncbi:lipocalin family protein [Flectobacillus major]|jgi:hypothetical protein|uniref:lipocalin family protein n=1 Tax=Flectobacillus major TaxID=103 RepID=UPI00131F0A98|nr:lipocalin family protein [Flectobacillus major]